MLTTVLGAVAVALTATTTYASELTSPFIFYSTAHLDLLDLPSESPTQKESIHQFYSAALSTCPTTHYLVVLQPGVSPDDFDNERTTPFLSSLATSSTGLKVRDIAGQVNDNWIINTILMDCLHHDGVKTVESLDAAADGLDVNYLSVQRIKESVIFAKMPCVAGKDGKEKLARHDQYIEEVVGRYFGGVDYTLLYVTQPATEEDREGMREKIGGFGQGLGAEVPLVTDE